MKRSTPSLCLCLIACAALVLLTACGGGGGSTPAPPPPQPALAITFNDLPGALEGSPYSTALHVSNAVGAVTWAMDPLPGSQYPQGLTIDARTGVISGTVNFTGAAGFEARVTDSASRPRTATGPFYLSAYPKLQPPAAATAQLTQYQNAYLLPFPAVVGGVPPLTYSVVGGTLPMGIVLEPSTGRLTGQASQVGTFQTTVQIRDSFSTPQSVTASLNLTVQGHALQVGTIYRQTPLNREFRNRLVAAGGVPPYTFTMVDGALPPGVSLVDPTRGVVAGIPTQLGNYSMRFRVRDSASAELEGGLLVNVVAGLGRNDTPAQATPKGNDVHEASISPYIDPPDRAPLAADNDYFAVASLGGSIVQIEALAFGGGMLDPVVAIVDGNGVPYNACQPLGATGTNYASLCVNDDRAPGDTNSAIAFKVPGAANQGTTAYVRVLDWRGHARPDMQYHLIIRGVVAPLTIYNHPLPASRGLAYSYQLSAANGTGALTWSLSEGTLPPGLTLSSQGQITGTPTANGTYNFTVQVSDAGGQTVTAQRTIVVAEPVRFASSLTLPNACAGSPYSHTMQTTGGIRPFWFSFSSERWVPIYLDSSTGTFSGMSTLTGTFTGRLAVGDATYNRDVGTVSLTVQQCP